MSHIFVARTGDVNVNVQRSVQRRPELFGPEPPDRGDELVGLKCEGVPPEVVAGQKTGRPLTVLFFVLPTALWE